MNILLSLGIIFISGLVVNKLISKFKLPEVTGDLIVGVLIGQELLDLVHSTILSSTGLISNVVLGFVAFQIGRNFSLKEFRKLGKPILWISVFEASGAWLLVTFVFFIVLKKPLYISLLYGAISSATAPAATMMVIRQYKAKGYFTKALLGVVAIDDAWCLIIFAISFAVSKSLYLHSSTNVFLVLGKSILEIIGALILGVFLGYIFSLFSKYFKRHSNMEIYTLSFVLLAVGIADMLHLSLLLTSMALGIAVVNLQSTSSTFFEVLEDIESPLYLLFFVLAGANLKLSSLRHIGIIGSTYFIVRIIGKVAGATLGGYLGKVPKRIRNNIGLGLLPQAGVALGVALVAKSNFPEIGNSIFTTIVATTVIYELMGPIFTKFGLLRSGEIR